MRAKLQSPFRALLVDLDGVIRHWQSSDEDIEAAHGLPVGSIRTAAFAPDLAIPAITGRISDEEWRLLTADRLRAAFPDANASAAVEKWTAQPGCVDHRVLSALGRCSTLKIVLVTNATSRLSQDLAALGIGHHFHTIVNSSEVRIAKPEPEILEAALMRVDAGPEQALFIDDTVANVEAGLSLGMRSHRFVGYEPMLAFLRKARVVGDEAL